MLSRRQWLLSVASSCLLMSTVVQAEALPADFQAKADKGIQVLKQLAGDAAIVAAAKAGTPAAGMTNAKWSDLTDQDATVKAMGTAAVSAKLTPPAGMGKLFLRDKDGNLVAFKGDKPFLFNIANRPNYKKSITGEDFIADKVAPDPSTQKPSVQIAVAVKDGVTVVGVLHASVE
ncbi:MAG: hypothetical protein B7Z05_07335 [Thiotrichales bacterium 32-46-8]|jgi:hypothetical protein|nr:hypothetical protein [Gammaproteobacteria bacterium]OYX05080.1 MAG: hypothetical protein B7Z05_07335 [Thiotrichales bacterium 32-46-8]OYY22926.1 MAG: hypothetical protein B7Y68_07365 [Thiotrichales bacterium 35-46-9]OYZ03766.1 MAG: hypothetical protein B7Y29_07835 [Thiotrichales bacterium 16-46-22]OYZ42004.1 MAG: hypothetical protein B7Y18_01515 [Thiotrichales bacterium 24-47-4]OZA17678.1 MAG: hypothetical protein B7X85_04760 [Thiotrichales bacterium 17-46-47]OZA96440.1 MAG: hypothetical p